MLSADLKVHGFSNWIKIQTDYESNKKLVLRLPKDKGIYVVRAKVQIPRVKGDSDIIYIGQGVIKHRIQALLRSFLPPHFRDYMNKHTAREEFERLIREQEFELELCYVLTSEDPKAKESHLLHKYCEDHIEPPPLNNTRK
jgi:hypothetical protein